MKKRIRREREKCVESKKKEEGNDVLWEKKGGSLEFLLL